MSNNISKPVTLIFALGLILGLLGFSSKNSESEQQTRPNVVHTTKISAPLFVGMESRELPNKEDEGARFIVTANVKIMSPFQSLTGHWILPDNAELLKGEVSETHVLTEENSMQFESVIEVPQDQEVLLKFMAQGKNQGGTQSSVGWIKLNEKKPGLIKRLFQDDSEGTPQRKIRIHR